MPGPLHFHLAGEVQRRLSLHILILYPAMLVLSHLVSHLDVVESSTEQWQTPWHVNFPVLTQVEAGALAVEAVQVAQLQALLLLLL